MTDSTADPSRRDVLRASGAVPLGAFAVDGTLAGATERAVDELEAALADVSPAPRPASFDGWRPGDLHCHTVNSHDVCADPTCEEPWTYGFTTAEQVRNAELKGFDYLAISDHNTVAAQSDPGYESSELALVSGYEHSLDKGHAGIFGVDSVYEGPTDTDGALASLLGRVHADGGLGVINHPRISFSSVWEYGGPVGMDAVEVWSIAWYLRSDRTVLGSNNHLALEMYDAYLDAGHRLAAVGGSDSHWRITDPVGGVGTPTTWVYAPSGEATDVVDGIRSGRTFVSWDWKGPLVKLEARTTGRQYDLAVGDLGRRFGERAAVRTTVSGASGHRVRLIVDGSMAAEAIVTTPEFVWETTVELDGDRPQNWFRAEVLYEDGSTMRALTSPVYLTDDGRPVDPEPVDTPVDVPEFGEEARPGDTDSRCTCHPDGLRRAFYDR